LPAALLVLREINTYVNILGLNEIALRPNVRLSCDLVRLTAIFLCGGIHHVLGLLVLALVQARLAHQIINVAEGTCHKPGLAIKNPPKKKRKKPPKNPLKMFFGAFLNF
jgi:hypothetical protein